MPDLHDRILPPRLRRIMQNAGVDAFWIADLTTIRYLTGFTGSAGHLLVHLDRPATLVVDPRYTLQAAAQCPGLEAVTIHKRREGLFGLFEERKPTRLGFEAGVVTVAQFDDLRRLAPSVEAVPVAEDLAVLRSVKTTDEIAALRRAIDIDHAALGRMLSTVRVGERETDLAWNLERAMREGGAQKLSFDLIVVSGARTALIHGYPSDKRVASGDLLLVDHGVTLDGWHTDRTDTFVVGEPTAKQAEIYRVVEEAHDRAFEAARPGVASGELDRLAREHVEAAGYAEYFNHSTGHGVGLAVHEYPLVAKNQEAILEPGMVITIEPGIYIPEWGGVRIEDMVLITHDGAELLTYPRSKGIPVLAA